MKKSRRKFIKLSSVIAGATLLPISKLRSTTNALNVYDVAIVGAGLAGLTTAYRLEQMGFSNIVILEGLDRVGGRTLNIPVEGGYVAEGGGQWIGPGQDAIYELMEELGISSFPSFTEGEPRGDSELSENGEAAYQAILQTINDLVIDFPIDAPWSHPMAEAWDDITLRDWVFDGNFLGGESYLALYINVAAFLGAPPDEISFLYFLFYVASAGSFQALESQAQEERIDGGAQRISLELANRINAEIRFESALETVNDEGEMVTLQTSTGDVCARKVVLCFSPRRSNFIHFISGLPEKRINLQEKWVTASSAKISVVYDRPFWRDDGYNGTAFGEELVFISDNSPADGSSGILMSFVESSFFAGTKEEREEKAIAELVGLFGLGAYSNIDYVEVNWELMAFHNGCVSPLPPGVLEQYGPALREPVGNIHWAGTETSTKWNGYMDGAIRSGNRVAAEIIEVLTNVGNPDFSDIRVYPTITNGIIYIDSDSINGQRIEIFNASGQRIQSFTQNKIQEKLDLGGFPSGMYTISIKRASKTQVFKVNKI